MGWARKIIKTMTLKEWKISSKELNFSVKLYRLTRRRPHLLSSKATIGTLKKSNLQNIEMTSLSTNKQNSSSQNLEGIPSTVSFSKKTSPKIKKKHQNSKANALRQLSCLRIFCYSKKPAYQICRLRLRLRVMMWLHQNVLTCLQLKDKRSRLRMVSSLQMVWCAILRTLISCGLMYTRLGTISILTDL